MTAENEARLEGLRLELADAVRRWLYDISDEERLARLRLLPSIESRGLELRIWLGDFTPTDNNLLVTLATQIAGIRPGDLE